MFMEKMIQYLRFVSKEFGDREMDGENGPPVLGLTGFITLTSVFINA